MGYRSGKGTYRRRRNRRPVVVSDKDWLRTSIYFEILLLVFAYLSGRLFMLSLSYLITLLVLTVVAAPLLASAYCKEKREHQKFSDLNSYMQQFISAMLLHGRILSALEEVSITFPNGIMHETITHMLLILKRNRDLYQAEKQAFSYMQTIYPNSQLMLIHDFALRVERTGGEFGEEMKLLSKKRAHFEKRTEHCQNAMGVTMTASIFLYVAMILVCLMVQRMMPKELSVLSKPLSQFSEVLLIAVFYLFVYMVLLNLARGWMANEHYMDAEKAKKYLAYVNKWCFFAGESGATWKKLFIGHRLVGMWRKRRIKKEIMYAVPRWLFDVCLLMQKYNITVSITESIKTAPPILQDEILQLLDRLKRNPAGVDAYLEFFEPYKIAEVKSTMRMLLALQNGTAGDTKMQMEQVIAHNMNMLDELDAKETELKEALNVRYNIYPMIPGAVVMGGYLISMIMQIFSLMSQLL